MLIVVVSGDHFAHVPREQPVLAQQVLKRLDVSDRIAQRVEAALPLAALVSSLMSPSFSLASCRRSGP
jgi:hypothetical protein